jgi:hypothetical protein
VDELSSLGAVCEDKHERLTCVYQRNVESAAWIVGSPTPKAVTDEFQIVLKISGPDGSLRFGTKFDRTSKVRAP